jgi:hypothetical protein
MGTSHEDQYLFFIVYHSVLRMKNFSDTLRENKNRHLMFNNMFQKLCCFWDNLEKYCRAEQATDDNMVYVHCMLDT